MTVIAAVQAEIERVRSGSFVAPPPQARLRRVVWAIAIHATLLRLLLVDPPTRRIAFRAWSPGLIALLMAGFLSLMGFLTDEFVDADDIEWLVEWAGGEAARSDSRGSMHEGPADESTHPLAAIGAFIGLLKVLEWVLIALTRQYGDALTIAASELIGVPPDDVPKEPRVCLDVRWLWTKVKRRITGSIGFVVTTAPAYLFLSLVLSPLIALAVRRPTDDDGIAVAWFTNTLGDLFTAVMLFGWIGVFTLGKSGHAWTQQSAPDLFFVRHAEAVVARLRPRVPRIASVVRLYERLVRRLTGFMRSPAHCVGRAPWETAGLVVARVVFSIPGMYIIGRPIIPVTSALILAARAPEAFEALPVRVQLRDPSATLA